MGYYSKVGLVLSKKAVMAFNDKITAHRREHPDDDISLMLLNHQSHNSLDQETGDLLLCWDAVKWYENFPEVRFILDFLKTLGSDDYLFIRIGEDIDDYEMAGSRWGEPFFMRMERNIAVGPENRRITL